MARRLRVVLGVVVATGATVLAQSFDLRLGQWEFTMTMPAAQLEAELAKMPPAMRAQMEAMMKKPLVTSDCLTAEDLKQLSFDDGDASCKITSSKMTRTTADVTRRCEGARPRTETLSASATSREAFRATMTSVSSTGTQTMVMSGKWLSATCKEGQ